MPQGQQRLRLPNELLYELVKCLPMTSTPPEPEQHIRLHKTCKNLPLEMYLKSSIDKFENAVLNNSTLWTLNLDMLYYWKNWKLIRTEYHSMHYVYIWCDSVALELWEISNGWLPFFMNGKRGIINNGNNGLVEYDDSAFRYVEIIDKLQRAKASVPSGAQAKSILCVPRASRTIQFAKWILSSVEAGTMMVTNRVYQLKLTIKEGVAGFAFEHSGRKQQFTADDPFLGVLNS